MPSPALAASTSPFSPFANRRFLTYWLTGLSGNLGWLIQTTAAAWAMTMLGGTPAQVGLIQTSIALPVMMFSLAAGALADAVGRRTIVLWSQSLLLLVSAALAVTAYMNLLDPRLLLGFTFLIGCGKALNNPGWQTMASEIVSREDLPKAIALGSVSFNLARTVGPALGGIIVATIGAFAAFAINALANFGVILVARRWPKVEARPDIPPEKFIPAIRAGLRYVSLSPNLLIVMARAFLFNFAAISVMALMPLVARDLLQGGPGMYGTLLGAFGLGGVTGALGAPRLAAKLGLETRIRLGFAAFAVATALIALSPYHALTLLGSAFAGVSWLVTLSTFNTTVQMSSPRWVLGRTIALYQTSIFAGSALGSWVWGYVAGHASVREALLVSGAVLLLGVLMGLAMKMREVDPSGLDVHESLAPIARSIDIVPQSGPIVTSIEYRIPEANRLRFLELMTERQQHRRRSGARRWTLSRDLIEPDLWTERFKTSTWLEVRRNQSRRTAAEARVAEELRKLLAEGTQLEVHFELVRNPGAARAAQAMHPDAHD